MKFCYLDESGTGDEPYGVMVGVIVDALRMRPTKADWRALLDELSGIVGKQVDEIHTRDFYAGNGPWRGIDGPKRAQVIAEIFDWLRERKHRLAYSIVDKEVFFRDFPQDPRFNDIKTLWRFLALHVLLSVQKHHQRERKNKGNTLFVFDNEEREEMRFTDLVRNPPAWTDSYYSRGKKQDQLDQLIDVPYFADSADVGLLQLADFVAYFLRRHVELAEGKGAERYKGEAMQVEEWVDIAFDQSIPGAALYPKKARCDCAELFYSFAPGCVVTR
jgi:hypothetical protein